MIKEYKHFCTITETRYMTERPDYAPSYIWCVETFGREDSEYFRFYHGGWKYMGNGQYGFKSKYKCVLFKMMWL